MIKYILYLYLAILSTDILASQADTLSLNNIDPVIIDSILISGNDITEEFIILRELSFTEGDSVNSKSLEFNRERIYSLGIFNFVYFTVINENNFNKLLIDVEEAWYIYPVPFLNIRENKLSRSSYGIALLWKNFRGRNEEVSAVISLGYDPSYFLSYYNPVLIQKYDISMNVDLAYTNFQNKSVTAAKLYGGDFDYNTFVSMLVFGKRLNLFNTVYMAGAYRYFEAPFDSIKNITASGKLSEDYPVFGLGYTYDSRDLAQFAKEGLYTSAKFYFKGFGVNDVNYNVFELDFREYRSISGNLSAKWRVAYRNSFGSTVPYYDYSVLGFDEYVRGHREDDRDGNGYILSSLEIAYPLLKEWDFSIKLPLIPKRLTSTRISIFLSAFGDTGTTFLNENKISINDFYSGYGLGLTLLFLPYNAFRFEYAFDEYKNGEFILGTGFSF
ncbi:MAG: hypothetical protein KJ571_12050 [Bacteroidetes bacterium]|nr:hypothetical protein [Bacteroidota bacterium]